MTEQNGSTDTLGSVLKDLGSSAEEIRLMQLLDRADKDTDAAFAEEKYKVTSGAVHRAVWPKGKPFRRSKFFPVNLFRELQSSIGEIRSSYIPWELFEPNAAEQGAETVLRPHLEVVRDRTIQVIQEREAAGTLWDPITGKITKDVEKDLGAAGYFGLLIEQQYGGQGATFAEFFAILTAVASKVDATFEGLASIHGCIGATRPLNKFGTPAQKAAFLPPLGDGTLLSFFGATERDAGTAIVNQKTVAVLDGDDYVINGAKMFISNAKEGRLGVIICKIDGKISALIAHLPETQDEHFQINRYKIDVLKHIENVELIFKDFRVPKENLLGHVGDGMKVAYDGLNFGRLAVLAGAAGISRRVLKLMVDWCQYRHSFGAPLSERQLPQARIARVASLIVAMDGLRRTCASRLDEGYRCEHECIQAKVLGSWWLKEIVIDNAMTTQGGRSFLRGNLIGEILADVLVMGIYEGENNMLTMKSGGSMFEDHGNKFMVPIAEALKRHGIKKFGPTSLKKVWQQKKSLWLLRSELFSLGTWIARRQLQRVDYHRDGNLDRRLQKHLDTVARAFQKLPLEYNGHMITYQQALLNEQNLLVEVGQRLMNLVSMPITIFHAQNLGDEASLLAADVLCRDMRNSLSGKRESHSDRHAKAELARLVFAGDFRQLDGVPAEPITFPYK